MSSQPCMCGAEDCQSCFPSENPRPPRRRQDPDDADDGYDDDKWMDYIAGNGENDY